MTKRYLICALLLLTLLSFRDTGKHRLYRFPELPFFPEMRLPINPVTEEGVALGRFLFYDPVLSGDSTISCGSCHKQANAFSDPVRFSAGMGGGMQVRNTLPLFNLAWHTSFFWDGRAESLEAQVFHPVRDSREMNMPWAKVVQRLNRNPFYVGRFRDVFGIEVIDSQSVAAAIGQFERTLLSYRSKFDRVLAGMDTLTADEKDGLVLMNDMTKADCLHCHTTDSDPLGTTFAFSNNGLDGISDPTLFADKGRGGVTGSTAEYGKFKIPSVRNLVFTAPYMHDGRFETLEAVLDFYSEGVQYSSTIDPKMEFVHRGGARLTLDEKKKVIAFLYALSDSAFVADPALGNPWLPKVKAKVKNVR